MTEQKIYGAIHAIQADLATDGIGKTRENQQQKYKFRGIDDILNELAPLFKKHKVFSVPTVLSREVKQVESKSGGNLFYSTVDCEFTFYSAEDGSSLKARVCGEAMDSGDKSTNKAMSAAMKYACILTFCIPTEGDNDADTTTHEVKSQPKPEYTAVFRDLEVSLAYAVAQKATDDWVTIHKETLAKLPENEKAIIRNKIQRR